MSDISSRTLGSDLMFLEGTDFSYENAFTWFDNIDKIIHYVRRAQHVNGLTSMT